MFESITFFNQNKDNPSKPLDIGALVECMLFYGKTNIVANQSILRQLFSYFGIERVIELINEDLLHIIYTESFAGIFTKTEGNIAYHDACIASSPQHTYDIVIRKLCSDITGKSGRGRRLANRIHGLIEVVKHESIVTDGARDLFLDQEYINKSAKNILEFLVPEPVNFDGIEFFTNKTERGVIVSSNIDFVALNRIYHKYVSPKHSTLAPSTILSHVVHVENEIHFSSNNMSEIATSDLSANLIAQRVNGLIEKSTKSSDNLNDFKGFIFNNAKMLREAVNNKQVDLDELIELLKKSREFKKWIIGLDPDESLIKNYYAEVTKETFVDKLPSKVSRWGIFTSAGAIIDIALTGGVGTAVGLGISALDAFYLDKLISGWKPNQFIEEEVKKLLEKDK